MRLGQGAETGPVRWCGARNKAIPNRSAAPASTPIGRKGTKNIIRQDVAPRRMRRERKCESKKDPKLYSKALFRKETEPISPGLGLDRRPAASRGIGRLYNLGLQPATTSLFTALTASREPWREDPFFGANNRMPMILKENFKMGLSGPHARHYFNGLPVILSYMRGDHSRESDFETVDTLFAGISRRFPH